jgi:hypothetical protein
VLGKIGKPVKSLRVCYAFHASALNMRVSIRTAKAI